MNRDHDLISRRALLSGAAAAGGAALLSGCAGREGGDPKSKATRTPALPDSAADWRRFEGSRINLLLNQHWWTSAIAKRIPQFEKLTGITVKTNTLSEDSYFQQALVALSSGAATYDGLMVGNLQVGQYMNADWLSPLDGYFDTSGLIDPAWYDLDDYFPAGLTAGTKSGELLALPISAEATMVMYRKDVLDRAGVTGFRTQDDIVGAARSVAKRQPHPFLGRGRRGLDIVWCWTSYFLTEGGRFFDGDTPAVDSPAGVAATEMYVETLLGKYGLRGASNMSWLECTGAFNEGKGSIYTDASGLLPTVLDEKRNEHAADVRVARWPKSDRGTGVPNYWYWLVGIPRAAANKEQAALFYAWATSKETAAAIGRGSGTPAARRSVWQDKQFRTFYPAGMADEIVANLEAIRTKRVPYARPTFPEEADALSLELVKVLVQGKHPKAAMSDAAKAMAEAKK